MNVKDAHGSMRHSGPSTTQDIYRKLEARRAEGVRRLTKYVQQARSVETGNNEQNCNQMQPRREGTDCNSLKNVAGRNRTATPAFSGLRSTAELPADTINCIHAGPQGLAVVRRP